MENNNNNNKQHQVFAGRKASKAGSVSTAAPGATALQRTMWRDFASVFPSLKASDDSLWETLPPYFWLRGSPAVSCVPPRSVGVIGTLPVHGPGQADCWVFLTHLLHILFWRLCQEAQEGCLWELPFLKPDKVFRWEVPGLLRLGKNLWSIWNNDGRWPCHSAGLCADGCQETQSSARF